MPKVIYCNEFGMDLVIKKVNDAGQRAIGQNHRPVANGFKG